MLDAIDAGVVVIDIRGQVVSINRAGRELLRGVDHRSLASTPPIADALRTRTRVPMTLVSLATGDRDAHLLVTVNPTTDTEGHVHFVCTLRDVAAEHRGLIEREQLLSATFRSMNEGVTIHEPNGNIAAVNPAAERILGLTREESTGRHAADPRWRLVAEDGGPFSPDAVPAVVTSKTGEPCRDVLVGVHRPDGDIAWLSVNSAPVFVDAASRTPRAVVVTFTDITEARKTRLLLEKSRAEFQRVTQVVPGMIYEYVVDEDGRDRFTFVSARAREVIGIEPKEVLADVDELWRRIHDEDAPEMRASIVRSQQTMRPWDVHFRVRRDDDTWAWIHGLSVPERRGSAVAWIGVLVDETEEHQLDESLRYAQRLEVLGDLAEGLAHNFNNLLGAILPNIEISLRQAPKSLEPWLRNALEATQGAVTLVRQLMEVAARGRDPGGRFEVDLRAVVQDALTICRQTFDRRIVIEDSAKTSATVRGNVSELQQVFLNLLLNARDAVAIVERPRIEVVVETGSDAVHRVRVTDNGIGMSEATKARLGEPLFTTKPAGVGTGLGIATVQKILRSHAGHLRCESTLGVGTTFIVELPAAEPPTA